LTVYKLKKILLALQNSVLQPFPSENYHIVNILDPFSHIRSFHDSKIVKQTGRENKREKQLFY
jgi:hypothetical protein